MVTVITVVSITNIMDHFPFARHCAKCFTYHFISFLQQPTEGGTTRKPGVREGIKGSCFGDRQPGMSLPTV